jgi:cation diffusion facilitator family transporter
MQLVLAANLLAAAVKLTLAVFSASAMLRGDAYFTLLDAGVDLLLLMFMRYAAKPADERHPYGHSKFEAVAVAVVAVFIFAALQDLGRQVLHAFRSPVLPHAEPWYAWVLGGVLVFNIVLAGWQLSQARRLGSSGLAADAWYTLTGCALTLLSIGALVGAAHGLGWPNVWGSVLAFIFTLGAGLLVARQALAAFTDEQRLDAAGVEAAALSVSGICGAHHIRSRGTESDVHVDLHVEVLPQLSVLEAHLLSGLVEQAIQSRYPEVHDVTVHIEPRMVH